MWTVVKRRWGLGWCSRHDGQGGPFIHGGAVQELELELSNRHCTALPPLTLQLHRLFPALWLIFQGTVSFYDAPLAPHAGHPSALPACGMVVAA